MLTSNAALDLLVTWVYVATSGSTDGQTALVVLCVPMLAFVLLLASPLTDLLLHARKKRQFPADPSAIRITLLTTLFAHAGFVVLCFAGDVIPALENVIGLGTVLLLPGLLSPLAARLLLGKPCA